MIKLKIGVFMYK